MNQRISDAAKLDLGLVAQALNNSNVTGRYHHVREASKILAHLNIGAMAATKTADLELLQAQDALGTGAKGIPSTAGQLAKATLAANALITKATITLATFLAGGTITINGIVFTAHATTTTPANREFSIAGTDTADAGELVSLINHATYGVPGVKASNAAGVVTVEVVEPGDTLLTIASAPDDATCVKATVEAQAFVEIGTEELDKKNGFEYVAAKVTTTANTVVAVLLTRGSNRFTPVQKMAASKVVGPGS